MDEIDETYLKQMEQSSKWYSQYCLYGEQWTVWIGKQKLYSNLISYLSECVHHPFILQHWDKHRIKDIDEGDINWEANDDALWLTTYIPQIIG